MIDVSIIVPVYGVEKYIQRCIESVIIQECNNVKIECIIIDDCSQDESMRIVEKMLHNYSGGIIFQIVRHQTNRGLSAARNTGASVANGTDLLFLDSDDQLASNAVKCLVEARRTNPEVDVVMGNMYECRSKKTIILNNQPQIIWKGSENMCRGLFNGTIVHSAWNKLVNRQMLIDNKVLFIEGILFEDISWTYNLFLHTNSLLLLPTITYIYEDNEGSIMNTFHKKADQAAYSYATTARYIMEHSSAGIYVEHMQYALSVLLNAIDIDSKFKVLKDTRQFVYGVRSQLIHSTLKEGRYFMGLYMYLILDLFHFIFRFKFFRRYFDRMNGLATRIFKFMYH